MGEDEKVVSSCSNHRNIMCKYHYLLKQELKMEALSNVKAVS